MKNRFLPFGLISAFLGLSFLFSLVSQVTAQPDNPEFKIHGGSWIESVRADQSTGMVNPMDDMIARQQARALQTKSTGGLNLNWLNMGPDNYPGITWTTIFDNTDPTGMTLISGAEAGGIWKSIDLGLTWTQLPSQDNIVPRVSSLVQTANGTIYAATGISSCKTTRMPGTGIYRSENGTFNLIPSTAPAVDSSFAAVLKMVVDPVSGRLFAATQGGLYYSDNGDQWTLAREGYCMDVCVGPDGTVIAAAGDSAYMANNGDLNSWVTLTTGLPNALPKTGYNWMVFAIAPSSPETMYASFAKPDGKLMNIYTSTDKGATWSVIFPNNPTFEPFNGNGCYCNTLTVFPNDPDKLFLGGNNMWYGMRSAPTGYFNWEVVSTGAYSPWYPNSAPLYHHQYIFRPNNPNQVVMSTDGGPSIATIALPDQFDFKTINKLMKTGQFNSLSFSSQNTYVLGGGDNIGTLGMGYFHPLYTNSPYDGYPVWQPEGLFIGGDGGTSVWSNLDSRIAVFSKSGATPAVRRQDLRDLTYANDFLFGVTPINSAHIPMRLWESFEFSGPCDSVTYISAMPDSTTIPAGTTVTVNSLNGLPFLYVTPIDLPFKTSIEVPDPIASRYFIFGSKSGMGQGIFMTKDMLKFYKDPEYFIVFKDVNTSDHITAMEVSADLSTLWAGTTKGRLIRVANLINAHDSATANATSSQCVVVSTIFNVPELVNRRVTSISIDPKNSANVLVTLGNSGHYQHYVYHTQNGNDAAPVFASKQSNLPKTTAYSGLIELHNSNNGIIGTELGVFSTSNLNDANPSWVPDMANIGDVAVTDIRQQTMNDFHIMNKGYIYIASYGRGIWVDTTYALPVGIEPPAAGQVTRHGVLNLNPNPVADFVNISYANENNDNLTAHVYDISGRLVYSKNFGIQPKGNFNGRLEVGNLPRGTYLIRLGSGHGKIIKL